MSDRADDVDYERFVDIGSFYNGHHTGTPQEFAYLGLGIAGEAGECADAFKKILRADDYTAAYKMRIFDAVVEASDVMWYVTRIALAAGLTLEDLRIINTVKLYDRLHKNGLSQYAIWPYKTLTYDEAKKRVADIEHFLRAYNPLGGQ